MDVAGLAGLLTALIGALAALTTLVNNRSQLRVLERLAAIREKLEPGGAARANVVHMETALSGRLLDRVQRSILFTLVCWGFFGLALGSAFAFITPTGFVYSKLMDFGFRDPGLFLGRSAVELAGYFIIALAMVSFLTALVIWLVKKLLSRISDDRIDRQGLLRQSVRRPNDQRKSASEPPLAGAP